MLVKCLFGGKSMLLARILISFAFISILLGISIKLLGIDLASSGYFVQFPVKPASFLNFSNSILLFSIALILLNNKKEDGS